MQKGQGKIADHETTTNESRDSSSATTLHTSRKTIKITKNLLVSKPLLRRCKLAQLVSNHILSNCNRDVVLPVMNHETNPKLTLWVSVVDQKTDKWCPPNEIRQNCACPCFGLYRDVVRQGFTKIWKRNEIWA